MKSTVRFWGALIISQIWVTQVVHSTLSIHIFGIVWLAYAVLSIFIKDD